MNTYIYIHICTINNWKEVVSNIYKHIIESGLLSKIKKIKITVLGGKDDEVLKILNNEKIEIIYSSMDMSIYERKCLELLREHSLNEEFKVLYLHSKGVSRTHIKSVYDWVAFLIYFNIDHHQKCIECLDDYYTCGVNLNGDGIKPPYHYSGNFWWAKSSYIKNLPSKIGEKYIDPEMWISLNNNKKMASLWQSNVNHYTALYPFKKYKKNYSDLKVIKEIKDIS